MYILIGASDSAWITLHLQGINFNSPTNFCLGTPVTIAIHLPIFALGTPVTISIHLPIFALAHQ
jgi:hypothetical protein